MIGLQIEVIEQPPAKGMQAKHKRAMRVANFIGLEHWRQTYLPLHFRRGNASRYGHTRRSKRTREKKRRLGLRVDNVETGLARRIAVRPRRAAATLRTSSLRIPGPYYFRLGARGRINSAEETLRVLPEELQACTEVAGREYEQEITRARSTRRKKV